MNISLLCALVTFGSSAFFCLPVSSQVIGQQKISNTAGNLGNFLEADARFGRSVTYLDDLNSNLVNELVVGADLANSTAGEVWVIFLDTDGKAQNGFPPVHIENGSGGLPWNALAVDDRFGFSCTEIGDLNGDGTQDLAVGAHGTDFGVMPNQDKGCVWILFMDPNNPGYVESTVQLKENQNGAPPVFDQSENFGTSIECIGDLDGDGVQDLAVGADPGLGSFSFMGGRVWILFMNSNGTIKDYFEIAEGVGGFSGGLGLNSRFGCDISLIGDLDNDQIPELAVGATGVDDAGAIYILFMNTDGSVRKNSKISNLAGNWSGGQSGDKFGKGLSWNPNKQQLISGASSYDGPNGNRNNVGQQWLLNLSSAGVVTNEERIGAGIGGFTGNLTDSGNFGYSSTLIGDINQDGVEDYAAGAVLDNDNGLRTGAVWVLFGGDCSSASWLNYGTGVAGTQGVPTLELNDNPVLGTSVNIEIGNSNSAIAAGVLLIGRNQVSIPLYCGDLLVQPTQNIPMLIDSAGNLMPIDIPATPSLCGQVYVMQSLMFDSGACSGVAMSAGLKLTFGY